MSILNDNDRSQAEFTLLFEELLESAIRIYDVIGALNGIQVSRIVNDFIERYRKDTVQNLENYYRIVHEWGNKPIPKPFIKDILSLISSIVLCVKDKIRQLITLREEIANKNKILDSMRKGIRECFREVLETMKNNKNGLESVREATYKPGDDEKYFESLNGIIDKL